MPNKLTLVLLLAQPFALTAGGIQGSVADAITNTPIPRAHVTLVGENGTQTRYGATSAAGGKFAFTGIPAGDYEALADRFGYVDQNQAPEGRIRVHVEDAAN